MGDDSLQNALPNDLKYFVQEVYDYTYPRVAGSEQLVLETPVQHLHPLLRENSFGTPDVYSITGKDCQLIDFKLGRRPVTHAETNLQGWTYALALFDTYPEIENITVHFVVPRVHRCTSHWTFNRKVDYDRMLTRVVRTVERAIGSKDRYVAWSSCAYCAAKATCQDLFANIACEVLHDRIDQAPKTPSDGNEAEYLEWKLNLAKLAKSWAEQTETFILKEALEKGKEVNGFELRFAAGKTFAKTLDVVALALQDQIPLENLAKIATVPLTELRKLYAESVEGEVKAEKDKQLMTTLAEKGALKQSAEAPYLFRLNKE